MYFKCSQKTHTMRKTMHGFSKFLGNKIGILFNSIFPRTSGSALVCIRDYSCTITNAHKTL